MAVFQTETMRKAICLAQDALLSVDAERDRMQGDLNFVYKMLSRRTRERDRLKRRLLACEECVSILRKELGKQADEDISGLLEEGIHDD